MVLGVGSGSGFRVQGLGLRAKGSGFRAQGLGLSPMPFENHSASNNGHSRAQVYAIWAHGPFGR